VLGGVLGASTGFVTDSLVGAGLALVVIVMSPAVAAAWGAMLLVAIALVLRATRTAAARVGASTYESSAALVQSLQEPLAGIKELKILGREGYFYDAFRARHENLRRAGYLAITLEVGSSLAVQAVLFCGALALIVALAVAGRSASDLPAYSATRASACCPSRKASWPQRTQSACAAAGSTSCTPISSRSRTALTRARDAP
jgi:ABC-type transport system involved in cytochrome bd biosynthesis fused ATPase/permease subunit